MPRKRLLTKAQTLLYLQRAKFNRAHAACLAGVSRATIYNAMRRHRITAPRNQCKLESSDVSLIRQLVAEGVGVREVSRKFDCAPSTISQIAHYGRRRGA